MVVSRGMAGKLKSKLTIQSSTYFFDDFWSTDYSMINYIYIYYSKATVFFPIKTYIFVDRGDRGSQETRTSPKKATQMTSLFYFSSTLSVKTGNPSILQSAEYDNSRYKFTATLMHNQDGDMG